MRWERSSGAHDAKGYQDVRMPKGRYKDLNQHTEHIESWGSKHPHPKVLVDDSASGTQRDTPRVFGTIVLDEDKWAGREHLPTAMAYGTAVRSSRQTVTYSRAAKEVLERHLEINPAQRTGVHFRAGHLRRGRPVRASSHTQRIASGSRGAGAGVPGGSPEPCTCWQEAARLEMTLQCRRLNHCGLLQFLRALMGGQAHFERRDVVEVGEIVDPIHPAKAEVCPDVAYGLFAKERIEPGEWCQRYTGHCCTSREELQSLNEDLENARQHAYTFRCDEVNGLWKLQGEGALMMDATDPGGRNETAYINHGGVEGSNVGILGALVDGQPCVFLYNQVAVEPGAELLVDYGGEYWVTLDHMEQLETTARCLRNLEFKQVKLEAPEELVQQSDLRAPSVQGPPACEEAPGSELAEPEAPGAGLPTPGKTPALCEQQSGLCGEGPGPWDHVSEPVHERTSGQTQGEMEAEPRSGSAAHEGQTQGEMEAEPRSGSAAHERLHKGRPCCRQKMDGTGCSSSSGGEDEAEPVGAEWNFVFPDTDSDEDPSRSSRPSEEYDVP
ncbi:hypothetical protein CYMTET_22665, partial [Cymbomonas tetramitiformis]